MVYYISDLHNYDKNIMMYEHRPFSDCEEMRKTIITNWNNTVSHNDEVFLLGDIGDPEIIKELSGKISIVIGNHDNIDELKEMYPHIDIYRYPIIVGFMILSHEPMISLPPESPYLNIHGHIHRSYYGIVGSWEDGRRHFNASVEPNNYTPVSSTQIADIIQYHPNRRKAM